MRLNTQLRRSLFALPLLVVALFALASIERPVPPTLQVWEPAGGGCAAPARPVGARGLARMPGDLSQFSRRMRCAG